MGSSRVIPTPENVQVDLSKFHLVHDLHRKDAVLVERLKRELIQAGVLDREIEHRDIQTLAELNDMIAAATKVAKSEKELNPDFYDPDAEAVLGGDLDYEDDWVNPSLDGIDDYGYQAFDNELAKSKLARELHENTGLVKVRLPNGQVVYAELV